MSGYNRRTIRVGDGSGPTVAAPEPATWDRDADPYVLGMWPRRFGMTDHDEMTGTSAWEPSAAHARWLDTVERGCAAWLAAGLGEVPIVPLRASAEAPPLTLPTVHPSLSSLITDEDAVRALTGRGGRFPR